MDDTLAGLLVLWTLVLIYILLDRRLRLVIKLS